MVEKPMAWSVEQARDLRDLAARDRPRADGRPPAALPPRRRQAARADRLGRAGRGALRVRQPRQTWASSAEDENALWSLGVHDISVVLHLLDGRPVEVWARGEAYVRPGVEDVVFGYVKFDTGQIGHLHLSWLDPHKMRKMTVVGSSQDGRVRRHGAGPQDHGLRQGPGRALHGRRQHAHRRHPHPRDLSARSRCGSSAGRSWRRCAAGHAERAGPDEGLAVVEVLEAMQRSLEQGGATQVLEAARA